MMWFNFIILGWTFAAPTWCWTFHHVNKQMNWTEARKLCQEKFTDMVVIQTQKENDYIVSILPNKTQGPYFWIGITKKHRNETWRWVGNNSTWVGENSWAKNEPNNNHSTEFCVEIYVKSGQDRGKWNDEKCARKKYPVCYKAQCNEASCVRGTCWETISSTTCLCQPGFEGDKCQTGFIINGSSNVTCDTNRTWSDPQPVCSDMKCPPLPEPSNGSLTCTTENQIFNSTCHFKCHLGFFMIGSSAVTCAANGHWIGPRPICASYKQALLAVAGCGAMSSFFCICFCCMKHRKRKKLAQDRQSEDATSPSIDVNQGTSEH